ncbi:MAG: hypothetical protein J5970_04785 [Bacilli bacterium]|nr:hypothetical protein [Bacilli bacterium]
MKIKDFKKLNTKNKILLNIILLIIIIFLIFLLVYNFKITKLERIKINEFDKKTSVFMEEYADSEDEGKYINYAIEYLNSKNNSNEFSIDDVLKTINNTFDENYTKQKLYKIGITISMHEKGIVFDDSKGIFRYNDQKTRSDIAKTPIVKYELKRVKKKSKNRFVLVYSKLVVDDPYKILNYYNGKNDNKKIGIISSYLKGESNIVNVKKIINSNNIKEFGKVEKNKKVVLKIVDKKLIIQKIK